MLAKRSGRRRTALRIGTVVGLLGVVAPSATPTPEAEASVASVVVPVTAGPVPTAFAFSGSGYGHGVGMSQYGALGMAREGRAATEIVTHYYSGTAVTPVADAVPVRINVLHRSSAVVVDARTLARTAGAALTVSPTGQPTVVVAAGGRVSFTRTIAGIIATISPVTGVSTRLAAATAVTVRWTGATPLAAAAIGRVAATSGGLSQSLRLRYGLLQVLPSTASGMEVVNVLRLHDEYLFGIAEIPSSWPAAALEAQAIAARSFALHNYQSGLRSSCRCHMYSGTTDQNFVGYAKESATMGDRWVAAVRATSPTTTTGLTVTYRSAPIAAYYSSSTGGRTQNSEDVWGSVVPYARSVDDHWSLDPAVSPWAVWRSRVRSQAQVAAIFGLSNVASLDLSDRTAGTSLRSVTATSSTGRQVTVSGPRFAGGLGLPSRWVWRAQSVLSGDPVAASVSASRAAQPSAALVVGPVTAVGAAVAAAFASSRGLPLLVTPARRMPANVVAEIRRRAPRTIYLVGTGLELPTVIRSQVLAKGRVTIRVGATTPAGTAIVASRWLRSSVLGKAGSRFALVASAGDALSVVAAAAIAGRRRWPLLLLSGGTAVPPAAVLAELRAAGVARTFVVGSTGAVSVATATKLPGASRIAGTSAAQSSALLISATLPLGVTRSVAVSLPGYAGSAAIAASRGQAVLWVGSVLPPDARRLLQRGVGPALTVVGPVSTTVSWAARRA